MQYNAAVQLELDGNAPLPIFGMPFRLVFDATTVRYPIWLHVLPWIAAAIFGLALLRFPRLRHLQPHRSRVFAGLLIVAGLVGSVGLFSAQRAQRDRVVGALNTGRYELVEGRVTHFRPGSRTSHPPESFAVGPYVFTYAPAEQFFGFNTVAECGGPIREGLTVRIASVDGIIARLEIAASDSVHMPSNER